MILLYTDFGVSGPYVGQMKTVLAESCPGVPVIDLMHDAPAHDPMAAAYLLRALVHHMPRGAVCLGIVDPGVGTVRRPLVLAAQGRWFVGPDNGLFELVARDAGDDPQDAPRCWRITWAPETLSASFHGRDLFAPVAARLGRGALPGAGQDAGDFIAEDTQSMRRPDWPDALDRIVYIDAFGNAMTGWPAGTLGPGAEIGVGPMRLARAGTFGDVPPGTPFWYENSIGLVEISVNRGSAADRLGLAPGSGVVILSP